jgi:hypothetical protein
LDAQLGLSSSPLGLSLWFGAPRGIGASGQKLMLQVFESSTPEFMQHFIGKND